jgi:hypothetical protein
MKRIYNQHLSLFLTNECNNACNFCLCSSSPDKKTHLDFEIIKQNLKRTPESRYAELSLGGGEPTLYLNLFNVIDEAIAQKWDVLFHTNLRSLKNVKEIIEKFKGIQNQLTITVSYNQEILRQNGDQFSDYNTIIHEIRPHINMNFLINVFSIKEHNYLIDQGFSSKYLCKIPMTKIGRGKNIEEAAEEINTENAIGQILCSDGTLFQMAQFKEACEWQSNLD